MNRSSLKKVTRTVRGKHGSTRRSYWVKAESAAKRVANFTAKHRKGIAAGVALVGLGYGIYKARNFNQNKAAAFYGFKNWVDQGPQRQAYRSAAGRKDHTSSMAGDVAEAHRRQQAASDWRNHVVDKRREAAGSANLRLPRRTYRKRRD